VGGYYFAKTVADSELISFRKAQRRLLKRGGIGYEELFEDYMEILEDMIGDAIEVATQVAPIDELELVGGGTSFKFVVDTIRDAANLTALRDLGPTEVVALGTVATIIAVREKGLYPPTVLHRLPPASMNLTCGHRNAVYCVRNGKCFDYVQVLNLESVCTDFSIVADPATIPEGTNPVLASFTFTTPVTLESPNRNYTMKFVFEKPDATITKLVVCISEDECEEEQFELANEYDEASDRAFYFMSNYLDAQVVKELRTIVTGLLDEPLAVREASGEDEEDSPFTEEMRDYLTELSELRENGTFKDASGPELHDMLQRLSAIAKELGMRPEHVVRH
jgi:hypothetical protein